MTNLTYVARDSAADVRQLGEWLGAHGFDSDVSGAPNVAGHGQPFVVLRIKRYRGTPLNVQLLLTYPPGVSFQFAITPTRQLTVEQLLTGYSRPVWSRSYKLPRDA